MTDNGTTGSEAGPSSVPKAIGSLAKKKSDVTRQGTQKLKFVPTLPARRKKEEVKQEASPENAQAAPAARGDGRGRGRGRGRGGETRGAAPRPAQTEMVASGPFAMGPALAGTSARRTAPRSNFTPTVPLGPTTGGASLGSNLSNTPAPQLKRVEQRENMLEHTTESKRESDEEVYSEPDEGVEIVDMEDVGKLDWMAPETIQKERRERKKKKVIKTEIDDPSIPSDPKGKGREVTKGHDIANVVDPTDSEEEAELEDLNEDFAFQANIGQGEDVRQERIYLFQFPDPFFTFVSSTSPLSTTPMDVDIPYPGPSDTKRVSFAADVKPPAPMTTASTTAPANGASAPLDPPKVDGTIGRLEVYRSGTVKMRLGNDILLDVSGAIQTSFLQQAVHLDMEHKRLHVLGEVNKRFVVSPDLDTLLAAMEAEDTVNAMNLDDPNLIKMDP
ncbi:RNA polymerase III RPC4-domain-containing protein [Scleroderma yunnanense]